MFATPYRTMSFFGWIMIIIVTIPIVMFYMVASDEEMDRIKKSPQIYIYYLLPVSLAFLFVLAITWKACGFYLPDWVDIGLFNMLNRFTDFAYATRHVRRMATTRPIVNQVKLDPIRYL